MIFIKIDIWFSISSMLFDCWSVCLFRCEGEFDEDDDCEEVLVVYEWRDVLNLHIKIKINHLAIFSQLNPQLVLSKYLQQISVIRASAVDLEEKYWNYLVKNLNYFYFIVFSIQINHCYQYRMFSHFAISVSFCIFKLNK